MGPTINQLRAIDKEYKKIVSDQIKNEFERLYYHALFLSTNDSHENKNQNR